MKIKIFLTISLCFCVRLVMANEIDVLMAKTSIALGDEYAKIVETNRQIMQDALSRTPSLIIDPMSENLEGDSLVYYNAKIEYNKYRTLASAEYEMVFCDESCEGYTSGLLLPTTDNYLKREAFSKYELINRGSSMSGVVGRYTSIYAVNSDFNDHLLSSLQRMIDEQLNFDEKAREIKNQSDNLKRAYVDEDSAQIIGIDQALLKESNYSVDTQTQIAGYNDCLNRGVLQQNFEKDELQKAIKQLGLLNKNIDANLEKVFDTAYEVSGGGTTLTIPANTEWVSTGVTFGPEDQFQIISQGKWNIKGAAVAYQDGDIYFGKNQIEKGKGMWQSIIKVATTCSPFLGSILKSMNNVKDQTNALLAKKLKEDKTYLIRKIANEALDAGAEGYYFSFSDSYGESAGMSDSFGINLGVSYFVSAGASTGVGSSTGTSRGISQGGTFGLKLKTTVMPSASVGAIIGSFCDVNPNSNPACEKFVIGNTSFFKAPENTSGLTLWVTPNDKSGSFGSNTGSMQVNVRKSVKFANLVSQFDSWLLKECDENGYDCGLGAILENIAYIPNPFVAATSSFEKEFPDMPEGGKKILLEIINYLVELQVIARDIKAKELSMELNGAKAALCTDQKELALVKLDTTKKIISTYSRREQNAETKKMLLDVTKRYYEEELAQINQVREKNLQRIKRYYEFVINSYNYLYLDNFESHGEMSPYYEGNYFKGQIDLIKDLIFEITSINDLLSPNRGFVVYQLSKDELTKLQNADYREREVQLRLSANEFFCQGFSLSDQSRVMIEKVGVLLDIDPAREYLFFKNPHVRSTKVDLVHGSENRFFDFLGKEIEYWMPAQKRGVNGVSTRVLVDNDSDYLSLRDNRYFDRLSFRKTSIFSTWRVGLNDPKIRMYEDSDTTFSNPLLQGVKLVFWFNSTENQNEEPINQCLVSPNSITTTASNSGVRVGFDFDTTDSDFEKLSQFNVYRSQSTGYGYELVGTRNIADTECSPQGDNLQCYFDDLDLTDYSGKTLYYMIRSAHKSSYSIDSFMPGITSDEASFTVAK